MEKNPVQKKNKSLLIVFIFVTVALFFALVIFITNGGMNTSQGIILTLALLIMIIIGIVKITKLQSVMKSSRMNQSSVSTSIPPTASNNENNIDATVLSISQGKQVVSKAPPKWTQNIGNWLQKFSKPKQIIIVSGSFLIIIVILVIAISSLIGEPDTTITGTWEHEIGSVPTNFTWVTNVTMWNVDDQDNGYLYMDVLEDGTFSVTYNDVLVSYGTWEELSSGYHFVFNDPDAILMGVSDLYDLKGSKLYMSINVYWTKE